MGGGREPAPALRVSSRGRTFALAGLLEGRIPPTPDFPERLERFAEQARQNGLHGTLELDGGRFGFLGDGQVRALPGVGHAPEDKLGELVEDLLQRFPETERATVFSTLRTTERDGSARVRTLIAVRPDGAVERVSERDVLDEEDDPVPAGRRSWTALALAAFLLAAAGLWFDALGVRSAVAGAVLGASGGTAFDAFDGGDWGGVLSVEGVSIGGSPPAVQLVLARGPEFPEGTHEDLLAAPVPFGIAHAELLGRAALARGEGRLEFTDADGALLAERPVSLLGLFDDPGCSVEVPWPPVRGVHTIRFRW